MPTYDYQCTSCGKTFEVQQRMSDAPLTDCECGEKGTLKKLLSAGKGLIFKGSGFYITDYKNGSSADKSTSTEKAPKTESAPSTESKATGSGGHSCGSGCGCA